VFGSARRGGRIARVGIGTVAERLVDTAPRIPVRDLATLRAQFPGLGPDEIADRLIAAAVKGTMTVGAGVGAAAMMPTPPAMPAELATETLGVAAVEFKLSPSCTRSTDCGRPAPPATGPPPTCGRGPSSAASMC
jgi:hypothetical protein